MKNKEIYKKLLNALRKVYVKKNKKYFIHSPILTKKDKLSLNHCIKTTYVSSVGNLVNKFENKIKKFTKAKYVVCLVNGTSALHIALKLLKIKKDEEVLLPSFNFVASSNACLYIGAIPHYIDSNQELGIDLKKLENYLSETTILKNNKCFNKKTERNITACIPTYSYGHPFDIKGLIKICKKFKIKVIEDSSEALGTKINNKHAGTFGDLGILSFNGNKIITTGGGGAIITNNKNYDKKARHISATSKISTKFNTIHNELGYNYRMPNLNAALGISQIDNLNFILKKKNKLHIDLLKNIKKIQNYFDIFSIPKLGKSNNWIQLLVIKKDINIKELLIFLNQNNIESKKVWEINSNYKFLSNFPKMKNMKSKEFSQKIICLPSNNF